MAGAYRRRGRLKPRRPCAGPSFRIVNGMEPPSPVSVAIVVKDGMPRLRGCLDSVRFTRDITVVLDPDSRDGTREFLRERGVRVVEKAWLGFGRQHQVAATSCPRDWVLKLDSDEELSPALDAFLARFRPGDPREIHTFRRRNLVLGRWVRGGGWWPDRVRRLFNRRASAFTDAAVHETVRGPEEVVVPHDEEFVHHAYETEADFARKTEAYARLGAADLVRSGRRVGPLAPACHGLAAFLRTWLLRAGFRDGRAGLLIARSTARATWLKYALARRDRPA